MIMPDESPFEPRSRVRPPSNSLTPGDSVAEEEALSVGARSKPSLVLVNSFHSMRLSLDAAARWASRDPVNEQELALALRCAGEAAEIAWRVLTEK
jgi:hypothetical protein